ncbi:hypothetical protein ACFLTE_03780 [Bacteroidota bacterium]
MSNFTLMMVKYIAIFFILFISFISKIYCQGEIDNQKKIFYRNERSFRVGLNSNGYGIDYRYGKRMSYTEKKLYEVHLDIIKHPKEIKISNPYGAKFVFGKLNSLASIKLGYGYQKELFEKVDKGGISIKYFYSYGPSIGILKAIYYLAYYPDDDEYREEKFNSTTHSENTIKSQVPFYKYFWEMKIVPGIYGQAGFHFEYSKVDAVLHAIEVGSGAELFARKMALMDVEGGDQQFFLYLFVRYRFGKIIDPLAKKRKQEYKKYLREY